MTEKPTSSTAKKGLVIVNTGNGKGKTTAALGIILRAWGRGLNCAVVQFLKHEAGNWGEVRAAERLGIHWVKTGDGFTWTSRDIDETIAKAQHGWQTAQQLIVGGEYDIVLLDEFTYLLKFGWLDTAETLAWLQANKPPRQHIIITGRDAPSSLIEYADLVTEMQEVKHPYQQGILAQAGIEF